ncbi:MAG: DUF2231 domain-containing protein [Gammaproteobacteria bacterium]
MKNLLTTHKIKIGYVLIAMGILLNPWSLGVLLSDDGRVNESVSLAAIIAAQVFCIGFGLELLKPWFPLLDRGANWPLNALFILVIVASLVGVTCWGIDEYNRGHSHTVLALSELEKISPKEVQWTEDFYRRSLEAALKNNWFDYEHTIENTGFQVDRVNRTHYPNLEYMFDGVILDPERPEWLVYHDTPRGKMLMALMFFTNELEEVGPTPGGPLALWHYHPYQKIRCAVKELWTIGDANDAGECDEGEPVTRTPEMLHVWFIEHPLGRFTEMKIVGEYDREPAFDIRLIHPTLVHFAIGLFVIAVIFDVLGKLLGSPGFHNAAWLNLVGACVAVVLTVAFGMVAELKLKPSLIAHTTLDTHKILAFTTLFLTLVLALWRIGLRGQFPRKGALLYLLLSGTGVASIAATGYYGGEMVYRHGAAVKIIDEFARERYWKQVEHIYAPAAASYSEDTMHNLPVYP